MKLLCITVIGILYSMDLPTIRDAVKKVAAQKQVQRDMQALEAAAKHIEEEVVYTALIAHNFSKQLLIKAEAEISNFLQQPFDKQLARSILNAWTVTRSEIIKMGQNQAYADDIKRIDALVAPLKKNKLKKKKKK